MYGIEIYGKLVLMKKDLLSEARAKADTIDLVKSEQQRKLTQQYLLPTFHRWLGMDKVV